MFRIFVVWLTVSLCNYAHAISSEGPAQGACNQALESVGGLSTLPTNSIDEFRLEIRSASEKYQVEHPESNASMLRGSEAAVLEAVTSGHMIYLASGPDIYRPLFDFPRIDAYHLVDVLVGWGKNPKHVIDEISRRLAEFNSTSKVTIVDPGFLNTITIVELETSYSGNTAKKFIENVLGRPGAFRPLILSVEWISPSLGLQKKKFYVHDVLDSIPVNMPLVGILEAGWSALPQSEVFHALMRRLSSNGYFIFEDMEPINFDSTEVIRNAKDIVGPYEVRLSLPDQSTQAQMAEADFLKKNRISFEILISK